MNKRMTCEEALSHPWMLKNKRTLTLEQQTEVAHIFKRLKEAKRKTRFAYAMQSIFMITIDESLYTGNVLAFKLIDEDNSGQLDVEELLGALTELA
eukprot:CAMPEP_0170464888 /NCGR_PEP_ID=MMETSP0123-20130129/9431_1 /TAXON_ID=182087 /ORGANISM="Favella ehrenbergii, Strain Fehren 1" /LENGTH=95 /DNA_ID=CAMNT_0010730633 /DNA_START=1283 /DNA_END=1570 /DNA_ORIENTATION=-